jgi:hypothetical protein
MCITADMDGDELLDQCSALIETPKEMVEPGRKGWVENQRLLEETSEAVLESEVAIRESDDLIAQLQQQLGQR